ncbi:MAG: hypothetical protein ACRDSN_15835, partial [Pseudonocardiaceae bacterium]
MALIALFVALGGSAYALSITGASIVNGSVRGADIKNHSLTGKDVKRDGVGGVTVKESRLGAVPLADAVTHTAVLNSGGQLVRGRGVTAVDRILGAGTGRYAVIFNRDVRGCFYSATVADVSTSGPPTGQVTAASLPTNANGVFVRTQSEGGTPAARPFH